MMTGLELCQDFWSATDVDTDTHDAQYGRMTIDVMPHRPTMSVDEVRALPVLVDVPTAGRCFGLGRDAAYSTVRRGELPVKVLRLGRSLRVTRASILTALGIEETDGNAS